MEFFFWDESNVKIQRRLVVFGLIWNFLGPNKISWSCSSKSNNYFGYREGPGIYVYLICIIYLSQTFLFFCTGKQSELANKIEHIIGAISEIKTKIQTDETSTNGTPITTIKNTWYIWENYPYLLHIISLVLRINIKCIDNWMKYIAFELPNVWTAFT